MRDLVNSKFDNYVNITGTLQSMAVREGKSKKDGRDYISITPTISVTQTYGGKQETSEVSVSYFQMKLKKDGTPNPLYASLRDAAMNFMSVDKVGLAQADRVTVSGRTNGRIQENMYVNRNHQVVSMFDLNASFFNKATGGSDCATFYVEAYLLNISREMDREGIETGRLQIRGAVPRYGGNMDVLTFVVEDANSVSFVERNWETNQTVVLKGRIRNTSEVQERHSEISFGEDIPEAQTVYKRELVVTTGSVLDDELWIDSQEVRKAIANRSARKEQMLLDDKNKVASAPAPVSTSSSGFAWED